MSVVEHEGEVRSSAERRALWPFISDTERLNRFIGSGPVTSKPVSEGSARFAIRARMGPSEVSYVEEPYQWAVDRFFSFTRHITAGPMKRMDLLYTMEDAPESGTAIKVRMRVYPRYSILWPAVWFFSKLSHKRILAFARACAAEAEAGTPVPMDVTPVDRAALDRAAAVLRERQSPELVDRLCAHIAEADDADLQRIRPFDLAEPFGAERQSVLRVCLDAVRAGILELNWSVICPSCRGPAQQLPSLRELTTEGHCHMCDLTYGVDLDRVVEATFTPHPTVRPIEIRQHCIGGPHLVRHVIAQSLIEPGHEGSLEVGSDAGRHRLFVRGGATALVDVSLDAPERASIEVTDANISPPQVDVAPGGKIALHIKDGSAKHAKLERAEWHRNAATALVVSTMPEFRAHFGGEALRPGMVLKVARVAVLFSDLVGSTALYSKVGDAAAFGVVSDCLDYGRAIVERKGGTVVKTMGDAIMAAFVDPTKALEAGAETVLGWAAFREKHELLGELDIKVGVAAGPCTVVTANGVLDYFGQTVNSAARIQHLAGARQLVVPVSLYDAEPPSGLAITERFETTVKGIPEPLSLVRLGLPA